MLYSREHRRVHRLRGTGHVAARKTLEMSPVGDAIGNDEMAPNGTSATVRIETSDEAWYKDVTGSGSAEIAVFGHRWLVEQQFYTRPSIVEGGFKGIIVLRRLEPVS
jgi:hypothetical protein